MNNHCSSELERLKQLVGKKALKLALKQFQEAFGEEGLEFLHEGEIHFIHSLHHILGEKK